MGAPSYSEEELIYLYETKTKEKGAKLLVREINEDPHLPAYSTLYRRIGGEKEIIKRSSFTYDYLTKIQRICNDCQYQTETCGYKAIECLKGAPDYFKA